jgi:F0F1-type ATP synthase assembly protein I
MHDASCWLIVVAFLLGLLLTFALMIRRVKREVPVGSSHSEKESDDDSSG